MRSRPALRLWRSAVQVNEKVMDIDEVGLILAGLSLLVGLATLLFPEEVRTLKLRVRLLGVAGFVVGLILIVVAAAGGGDQVPGGAAAPPSTSYPAETTTSAQSGGDATGSTDAPAGSSTATVRWHDTIRIPSDFYVDLDDTGPSVGDTLSGGDFYSDTNRGDTTAEFYNYGSAGSAPAGGPSSAGCRGAIETAALESSFRLEPGEAVCILTEPDSGEQPHVAHVKVLEVERSSGAVTVEVTVWQEGSSVATTTTQPSATVRWHDTIRVPRDFYVDLDDTGPQVGDTVSGGDFYSDTNQGDTIAEFYNYGSAGSAPAGRPSFAGCRSAVETAALEGTFWLEPGEAVCILTEPDRGEQPHLVHAKVLALDRGSGAVTLDVTVWRQEP